MKRYGPIFYYLSLSNLFFFLGNSFFILLPVFLKNLGASETYIGFISNIDKIFMIMTALWLGSLIYGRDRVMMLRSGYIILCITYGMYLFIGSLSWYLPFIRILHGIGFSVAMILGTTIIFENVPAGDATEAIGIYGVTGAVSNAVSPAVGEFLLSKGCSHQLIFLLSVCCILVSLIITLLMPRTPRASADGATRDTRGTRALFKDPRFLVYAVVSFVFGGGFGVLITFFPNFIRTCTQLNYSYFFVIYIAVLMTIRFVLMHLLASLHRNMLLIAVFFIGALMNFFLNWLDNLFLLVLVSVMYGITHGVLYPVLNALLVNIVPHEDRGRANALFSAVFNGGMLFFACGLGLLIDYYQSYLAAFNVCGVSFLAACCLIACIRPRAPHRMP